MTQSEMALRDRVDVLERILGLDKAAVIFPAAWRLTPAEGALLSMLLARESLTREGCHLAIYGDRIDGGPDLRLVDIWASKLRAKLDAPLGRRVKIRSIRNVGYTMDAADRAELKRLREDAA